MKMPMTSSENRTLAVVAVVFISLYAAGAVAGESVTLNRYSFNPSLGETVAITVKTPAGARISVAVLDRDGFVTRSLAKDKLSDASFVATWDGRNARGAIVADEAYSFKVDVTSSAGNWTYFPAANEPKTYAVQAKHYSRRDAALMYELPTAARIHAQAGSATIDETSKKYTGPVLKTLVNREPRPAGAIVESWNGFDESGAIYVPDLPQFVTAILATELPENAVIAFGNKTSTFLDVATARSGASLLSPVKVHTHAQHHGLISLEDISPSLVVTPLNGAWDKTAKTWTITGEPLRLGLRLEGKTARYVARQPGKIVVFVDYVQVLERSVRTPTETIDLLLGDQPTGEHVVSVNWQSEYGPLSPNSIRVIRVPVNTAGRARAERNELRHGRQ